MAGPAGPVIEVASAGRKRWSILAVLVVSQLIVWLDNTVLNVALQTLADPVRGIGATSSELQWSISSYTLIFAALLFTGGVLGDRFGHQNMLLVGLVLFGGASVWAAYSGSPEYLIVARGFMGAGSALIMPATLAIINQIFDGGERATAIAMWSGATGLAIAAGPLVGGALLESFWWGSIFLINLPVVVVAVLGVVAIVRIPRLRGSQKFDPLGVLLSTAGLFALVYGVIEGGREASWSHPEVIGPMVGGVILLAAFVAAELRSKNPSFDMSIFRSPMFTGASLSVMLTFFGLTGTMYYSSFYLQGARGLSPLGTGLALTPVALGVVVGAPLSNVLVRRFGIQAVVTIAMLIATGSYLGYAFLTTATPLPQFWLLVFVEGASLGAVMAPTTDAVMGSLRVEESGAGSALNNAMRQTGGALGVAVLGSVLSMVYIHSIGPKLAPLPSSLRTTATQSAEATRAIAARMHAPALVGAANDSFVRAMHVATIVGAAVSLLGVVAAFVFFSRRLRAGGRS
ncbi:MAG: MFS transporter [Nocardiopsaceae bacterium]|nr:MFS transporter [Nocardiopsaceae bacterium]